MSCKLVAISKAECDSSSNLRQEFVISPGVTISHLSPSTGHDRGVILGYLLTKCMISCPYHVPDWIPWHFPCHNVVPPSHDVIAGWANAVLALCLVLLTQRWKTYPRGLTSWKSVGDTDAKRLHRILCEDSTSSLNQSRGIQGHLGGRVPGFKG